MLSPITPWDPLGHPPASPPSRARAERGRRAHPLGRRRRAAPPRSSQRGCGGREAPGKRRDGSGVPMSALWPGNATGPDGSRAPTCLGPPGALAIPGLMESPPGWGAGKRLHGEPSWGVGKREAPAQTGVRGSRRPGLTAPQSSFDRCFPRWLQVPLRGPRKASKRASKPGKRTPRGPQDLPNCPSEDPKTIRRGAADGGGDPPQAPRGPQRTQEGGEGKEDERGRGAEEEEEGRRWEDVRGRRKFGAGGA